MTTLFNNHPYNCANWHATATLYKKGMVVDNNVDMIWSAYISLCACMALLVSVLVLCQPGHVQMHKIMHRDEDKIK